MVAPRLNEDTDYITVLIHGPLQVLPLSVDREEHFVQNPLITQPTFTLLQVLCVDGTKLRAPLPNGWVRNDDSSFGKQALDLSVAQTEMVIEPDAAAYYFVRKTMPEIARSAAFHTAIVPRGALT